MFGLWTPAGMKQLKSSVKQVEGLWVWGGEKRWKGYDGKSKCRVHEISYTDQRIMHYLGAYTGKKWSKIVWKVKKEKRKKDGFKVKEGADASWKIRRTTKLSRFDEYAINRNIQGKNWPKKELRQVKSGGSWVEGEGGASWTGKIWRPIHESTKIWWLRHK